MNLVMKHIYQPMQRTFADWRATNKVDTLLVASFSALLAFGIVMVFSASSVYADQKFDDPMFFLRRQVIFALLGGTVATIIALTPPQLLRKSGYPMLGVSFVLMLYIALGFGHTSHHASRWIRLGGINIQPAELAKLAIVLWLAHSLAKKTLKIRSFSVGFLPHILVAGVLMLLCLKQPDFGSAVMIGVLTLTMLFVAGVRLGYVLAGVGLAMPVVYLLVTLSPYRMRRIEAFLQPFEHRNGIGYQVAESMMSFGAGGATGVGLGDSKQKLFYVPEAHNDFISAIVGEELGFIGIFLLVAAFATLTYRGLRVSYLAKSSFVSYIAAGASIFIGLQALTNLGVAMGMLPTKGLTLPFISYGGSSLIVNCAAVGLLMSCSRFIEKEEGSEIT